MNIKNYAQRSSMLATALLIMSLGIALCIRANLGITPISCPPYVLSLGLRPTIGQFTIAMHLLLIIGQILLLRKEFQRLQLLQIALALVFGLFIDFCMWLTCWIQPGNYLVSVIILFAGNILLALGMSIEMKARFILLPTDGFVQAASSRSNYKFSTLKVVFDLSLLIISVICSWLLLGRIEGIREGTLVSAILVGVLVGIFRKITETKR